MDWTSYILGIIATVIGSCSVVVFSQWIQTRAEKRRVITALFSEIRMNLRILDRLLGESDYMPDHWAYDEMSLEHECYDKARESGFLYEMKPEVSEKISKAYDIIRLITKEDYHPNGTASNTFKDLKQILAEVAKLEL